MSVAYLSREGLDFAKERLLGEVDEVILLSVLPLHDGTAVSSRELTLLVSRRHHQLGVLILQPATAHSGGETVVMGW